MENILVPTDFSEYADNALEVAYHLAKKAEAKITLLHVVEDPTVETFRVTGEIPLPDIREKLYVDRLIAVAREKLTGAVQNPSYTDVEIEGTLRLGNPYHNINEEIENCKASIVVMGTKGTKGGLSEVIMGSNAERVVRRSKCPVLTIHKKVTNFDYKNIVFASGADIDENQCLMLVNQLQQMFDATVHLVRVNTPNNFESDVNTYEDLEAFAKKCGMQKYTTNVFNDYSEEEGIIHFAQKMNADMIAMVTHGRMGFAHFLTGSIAEDVVNHAKRPVLTQVIQK